MYPPESPIACIKYKSLGHGITEEARNQRFALQALQQIPEEERKGIRIPEIYRVIETTSAVYIVMEYVPGKTLHELIEREGGLVTKALDEQFNQIEKALRLFLSFKVPDKVAPGPVGGGIIRHPIFKDYEASIEYSSVSELQDHVFKVTYIRTIAMITPAKLLQVANCRTKIDIPLDFTGEDMCFCFSDLFEGNFIFTETGSLYVVDFTDVSFLPTSFMTYAFDQRWPACQIMRDRFDLPQGNLRAMRLAGYYFMISYRKIGV